jgi:hypothetical protein
MGSCVEISLYFKFPFLGTSSIFSRAKLNTLVIELSIMNYNYKKTIDDKIQDFSLNEPENPDAYHK